MYGTDFWRLFSFSLSSTNCQIGWLSVRLSLIIIIIHLYSINHYFSNYLLKSENWVLGFWDMSFWRLSFLSFCFWSLRAEYITVIVLRHKIFSFNTGSRLSKICFLKILERRTGRDRKHLPWKVVGGLWEILVC